jgi:hypothetical protein
MRRQWRSIIFKISNQRNKMNSQSIPIPLQSFGGASQQQSICVFVEKSVSLILISYDISFTFFFILIMYG